MKLRSQPLYVRGKRLERADSRGRDAVGWMEPAEKVGELEAGRQNLRAVPRFEVDVDAHLLLVEHGSTLPCRVVDLSLTGCCLCTRDRFPARGVVRVEVTFKVNGLAFRFCGTTQWTDGRNQVGIRFVDVSARRKEEFLEAIAEVENAAKQAARNKAAAEEAAAMQAAEEQAAAELAAEQASSPPAGAEDNLPSPMFPARAQDVASQVLSGVRRLSILPRGGEARGASAAEATGAGVLASDTAAESGASRQSPLEPTSPGIRTQGELQRAGARLAGPSLVKPSGRERRVQSREGVNTSAVIFLINVASRLTGRILDLSLGGCRIQTDEPFPVGIYTRVETEFRLAGLPFRLGGVIQAIHDRHHVGIRFLDMSSRKQEQLEQLIAEIEEMKRCRE